MSLNILIAEDEENVGVALQVIIGGEYADSHVVLAKDGHDAWEKLQQEHFDLIVADWNMPIKTGDELLIDVRNDPKTRRIPFIMITARSDKDSVITAIQAGVTDYVRKPFEKKSLIEKTHKLLDSAYTHVAPTAISRPVENPSQARAAAAQATAANPVEEIARRLKAGETGFLILPDVALKIQEIIRSGESDMDVLVEAIKLDPSLTARLIAVANSTYYRADKECKTLKAAVLRIGFKEACDCALALSTRDLFQSDSQLFADMLHRMWEHSLAVGCCAGLLANRLHVASSESYYTMGLLHDIGKLLLANILKDLYKSGKIIDPAAISEVMDTYHHQFGAQLLKKWKYPEPFIELVLHHHEKSYIQQCAKGLMLVGVSNILVRKIGLSLHTDGGNELSDDEIEALIGMGQDQVGSVLDEVKNYVAEVKSLF
ncbi:MAG: HDOD domain-containing protein [Burkholderiales bacterium]|nr:HDOD domain-containing protein [Burkholderiales bacterium]